MQTRSRLFDDLARMANGALSAASGVRTEVQQLVNQQFERFIADRDLVTREEFEAVEAMAAKARQAQDALEARVKELEAKLADSAPAKTASAKSARAKTAPKRKAATGDRRRGATTARRSTGRSRKSEETPGKDE